MAKHSLIFRKSTVTIRQIVKACHEFGLFQVVNHRVSEELMDDAMKVLKECFSLPAEYTASSLSNARDKSCFIYSSSLRQSDPNKGEIHYWTDCLTHPCHPLEDHLQFWPETPTRYQEVIMRKFLMRVLDLTSEGLVIDPGYFEGDLSKIQRLSVNHHIPWPDPSLTLAHPEHYDPSILTNLHQCDVSGFQFFKDGQWIGVEPLPSPFMVISNGKFTSPKHRVVMHTKEHQTTGNLFIHSNDAIIEPATASLSQSNPPLYRTYKYKDFIGRWIKDVTEDAARDRFKVQDRLLRTNKMLG